MRASRVYFIVALTGVLTGAIPSARADDTIETVELGFAERRGKLVVKELGLSPLLFDEGAYRKLKENPLATAIVVRLYVYRKGEEQPISYALLSIRIVYDLWLEQYEVRMDGPSGQQNGTYPRLDQAYKVITEIGDVPVADLIDIPIGPHHYLGMVAELNPISDETMAEVRRWLTRPAGAASLERGTSFFGSFVSVFVNAKLPQADRVVRARSQPFYRVMR